MSPRRSFSDTVIYDESGVEEKYGISAGQLAEFKALTGDPSDNIPGIPGIGDKTAAKLLRQFGSLDGIYDHIDKVSPEKLQTLLRDYKDRVLRNKELATIVTEVPITLNLDACHVTAYDRNQVVELFRELGFVSLLSRLPEDIENEPALVPRQTCN